MNKYIFFLLLLISGNVLKAQDPVKKDSSAMPSEENRTYTKVEIEPAYPGGAAAWTRYLKKNLTYPDKARRRGVEGDVVVQFLVDTQGRISKVRAVNGDPLLEEEAVRLVEYSGLWTPAIQGGKQVRAYKLLKITFSAI